MMAKDRNQRYASTSDLLLDLEAIAAGQPPLQARRQIDAGVLTALADEATTAEAEAPENSTQILPAEAAGRPRSVLLALAVGLGISVVVNLLLLIVLLVRG